MVGPAVGITLGEVEGATVVASVGITLSEVVGPAVGMTLGEMEGATVGSSV